MIYRVRLLGVVMATARTPDDDAPSRRDFVLRAGQLGCAIPPALYAGLRWRTLGPFRGGRVCAVSGVPGRPNEFYFGHANGGV
jgi:hypothetical protein